MSEFSRNRYESAAAAMWYRSLMEAAAGSGSFAPNIARLHELQGWDAFRVLKEFRNRVKAI